uniref:Metalloendopeptidase n=1 Tax=Amphiprion percula TaxID=161767 RepID=A0A3P8RS33_AMPPE
MIVTTSGNSGPRYDLSKRCNSSSSNGRVLLLKVSFQHDGRMNYKIPIVFFSCFYLVVCLLSSTKRKRRNHPRSEVICRDHLHPLHAPEWTERLCGHPVQHRVRPPHRALAAQLADIKLLLRLTARYFYLLLFFRCFSFVGRRGGGQTVSLRRQGCIFRQIIQHELLHALGFNHEQTRSDRDQHVRILLQNVIQGMEFNFRRINTRNLGTPYDYNSVMHYGRFAFSRNRQPTIVPIPNENVAIGRATTMSATDILRVNRLYRCNTTATIPAMKPVWRNQVF